METRKKIGFILGHCLFLVVYFLPILGQNPQAHTLLSIFLLIVVWWVTECIPIPITALFIPIFLTVFKVTSVKAALAPFSNPIILLFLGSFILARAMCVHALDKKLAYSVLSIKNIGQKKTRVLFAMGLTSLFLSMWISNTATTAMMYPIALGVLDAFRSESDKEKASFGVILLLTLAYSASIGGIGTPIGSPPNLIAIGMLEKLTNYRIDFFQWMVIGFLILIPMYFILFFIMKSHIKDKTQSIKTSGFKTIKKTGVAKGFNRAQKTQPRTFARRKASCHQYSSNWDSRNSHDYWCTISPGLSC